MSPPGNDPPVTADDQAITDEDLAVLDAVSRSQWILGLRLTSLDAAGYGFFPAEEFASVLAADLDNPYGHAWFSAQTFHTDNSVVGDLVAHRFAELGPAAGSGSLEIFHEIRAHISENHSTED